MENKLTLELDAKILQKSDNLVIKELKSIGYLSQDFKDTKKLIDLSMHDNKNIRFYSIQNIAKLSNVKLLKHLTKIIDEEKVSLNRREIVSAIGRIRSKKSLPLLLKLIKDKDPNVILQSIRGLLVFKKDSAIEKKLKTLKNHSNELVRKVIDVEFYDKKKYANDHADSPSSLRNCILNDDVRKVLKKIPDESLHLTFTSPPYYNARDYSIYNSYESYIMFLSKIFKELHRVTKEGRFFVLNTSPIIVPRVGRKYSSTRYPIPYDLHKGIISSGWEFIDDIIWVKPEPSAKNRVAGFEMHRKPLAYKPNCITESVMVYRKKSNKLIDWIYDQYPDEVINSSKVEDGYETNNVWKIDPCYSKKHSAVFPLELCNKVINYYSFKGDLVFDPFAGSGTVGVSANVNERYFLLTENNDEYYREILKKLKGDLITGDVKTSF